MRLLHAKKLTFHEYFGTSIPKYAILLHRWEEEEVNYQEMQSGKRATKARHGYKKVQDCCQQALQDGIYYLWVDTRCIDESSSADLTEAINSMYNWYQEST